MAPQSLTLFTLPIEPDGILTCQNINEAYVLSFKLAPDNRLTSVSFDESFLCFYWNREELWLLDFLSLDTFASGWALSIQRSERLERC
jgi:hypothetical protein